jgi:hypothetical protein
VIISGEMCVLSLIYSYVAVNRFCAVRCLIIMCLYLLFSNYSTLFFKLFFTCFLFCKHDLCFVYFYVFILFCIVFSALVYSCLFPLFVKVYRPLPPGGNQIAVNKYINISYLFFISRLIGARNY